MPSRNSRAAGAPLDPYGIYGTRTQARLRASQRRRQSQNLTFIAILLLVVASIFLLSRWRREKTDVAPLRIETGAAIDMAPIFAPRTETQSSAILIANRDGILSRYDNIADAENNAPQKTILLRDDFPLHAPLLAGDVLFAPSESGVLTALLWREKKVLWRKKFDDALTAQPAAFSIARPSVPKPIASAPPAPTSSTATSPAATAPTANAPNPTPPKPALRRVVVAASDAGLVMAIDVGSGQTLWRARMPAPVGKGLTAVEANGRARVLVPLLGGTAMRGGVWCLDGESGKVLWRFPQDARAEAIQFAAPLAALKGNRVYFGNDLGAVFALNLTTGTYDSKKKIGWKSFATSADENSKSVVLLRAAPLLVQTASGNNQRLVVGGNDGIVRALSADTGSTQWQYQSGAPVVSLSRVQVTSEPSQILVVTTSPQLILLDAQTGKQMRRLSGGKEIFVGAVVSQNKIFATTENGIIHRFALRK